MKKGIIYGLSILLLAGAAISCRKTSKGKMSNEWKLDSYSSTETSTDDSGDMSTYSVEADESSITITDSETPNGGSTTTNTIQGTVNEFSFVINKDGTWERTFDITTTQSDNGITVTSNDKTTSSGTWNFLGKVEEFKKNERVVFNTLSETVDSRTETTFSGSTQTDTSSETETYANGENSEVMLIVESKRKELQLKSERDYTSTEVQNGNTNTYSVTAENEWSLVQED